MDIRGECRDDDTLVSGLLKELVEAVRDRDLCRGKAGPLRIGGVGQKRQYALPAKLAKTRQIDNIAYNRRVVDFKVARLDNDAGRRVDRQRDRVGDRVVDADKFNLHAAELNRLTRCDLHQLDLPIKAVLPQLVLDQPERKARRVDRNVDLF